MTCFQLETWLQTPQRNAGIADGMLVGSGGGSDGPSVATT